MALIYYVMPRHHNLIVRFYDFFLIDSGIEIRVKEEIKTQCTSALVHWCTCAISFSRQHSDRLFGSIFENARVS